MAAKSGRGSRNKGAKFQRDIRDFLTRCGLEPLARPSGEDGDDLRLLGLPSISLELKSQERMELADWMGQAIDQAGERIPAVIHKRRRHGADTAPHRQWVTLELGQFVRLLRLIESVDHRDWKALAGGLQYGFSSPLLAFQDDDLLVEGEGP